MTLKPCPFCGGTPERVDIEDGENAGGSCIACTVCMASGNVEFERKENFVSNWNRRAALASPAPASEEVKPIGYVGLDSLRLLRENAGTSFGVELKAMCGKDWYVIPVFDRPTEAEAE
jgi:Lar family restriction alleviation protein